MPKRSTPRPAMSAFDAWCRNRSFRQELDRHLAPEGEQMTRERVFLRRVLHRRHRQPVHSLSHVGMTQCQVHLHACRNNHHFVVSRSATKRRTASGSLSSGAKTRRPSLSSTAVMPSAGHNGSCSTSGADDAFDRLSITLNEANHARSSGPKPT